MAGDIDNIAIDGNYSNQFGITLEPIMTTVTIKNVPDDLYKEVKQTAKRHHRSINSEIIACLESRYRTGPAQVDDILAKARAIRKLTAGCEMTPEQMENAIDAGRP